MAFDSELAAKICSSTFSPEAAALLALAEVVLADAELAEAEPEADDAVELPPDEQPTSANAATRAAANAAANTM